MDLEIIAVAGIVLAAAGMLALRIHGRYKQATKPPTGSTSCSEQCAGCAPS